MSQSELMERSHADRKTGSDTATPSMIRRADLNNTESMITKPPSSESPHQETESSNVKPEDDGTTDFEDTDYSIAEAENIEDPNDLGENTAQSPNQRLETGLSKASMVLSTLAGNPDATPLENALSISNRVAEMLQLSDTSADTYDHSGFAEDDLSYVDVETETSAYDHSGFAEDDLSYDDVETETFAYEHSGLAEDDLAYNEAETAISDNAESVQYEALFARKEHSVANFASGKEEWLQTGSGETAVRSGAVAAEGSQLRSDNVEFEVPFHFEDIEDTEPMIRTEPSVTEIIEFEGTFANSAILIDDLSAFVSAGLLPLPENATLKFSAKVSKTLE